MILKRIIETLPLLGSFLIFNGFLKLYIYYDEWNINIIDYLEISEIILSFLNDINLMVFWLVIFFIQQVIAVKFIDIADRKLASNDFNIPDSDCDRFVNQEKLISQKGLKPLSSIIEYFYNQKLKWLLLILFVLTMIFGVLFIQTNKLFWLYFAVFSVFKLSTTLLDYFMSLKNNLIFTTSAIITTLVFTYGVAIYDIKERKLNSIFTQTTIELEDRIIESSSTLFFVGKTQKFVFFYDKIEMRAVVIPMDKVEMLSIKKN